MLAGSTPTEQVRETVDRVIAILQDPTLKPDNKREQRRELLREVIAARFDFDEMAKRSLGAEWRRRTPAEQQEFVELFANLLRDAYVGDIESYKGEKVKFTREAQDENYAEVQTLLASPQGATYAINYRLHRVGDEWKAYDVVIENVSLVNNYRSQFSRFISRSSYEDLVRSLRERVR